MGYTSSTVRLCETVFDITTVSCWLQSRGKIVCDDSREMFFSILHLANKFEESFNPDTQDYMESVEEYAEEELIKRYSPEI